MTEPSRDSNQRKLPQETSCKAVTPADSQADRGGVGLETNSERTAQTVFGSLALTFAALVLVLAICDHLDAVGFRLPRSWYTHRPFWYGAGVLAFATGWKLLRDRHAEPDNWTPSRDGVRFHSLRLYTRTDCHLCDLAKDVLWKYRDYLPAIEEIDIDQDTSLRRRFDTCVPVVELDEKVRFRGRVDERLLRRLIEATAPSDSASQPWGGPN